MSAVTLHAKPSANYSAKLDETSELLKQAAKEFGTRITQASSLGVEDMVISHLADALGLNIGIFVLETGMLHPETLQLLKQLKANSRAPVAVYTPKNEAVVQFVAREGQDAMYKSVALRKACCHLRKVEPLERALADKDAWMTGMRRTQSSDRADVPLIDRSNPARIKFNPLANWTWGDVWHYVREYEVPYNPLHDQFYPSIGCAPCTRPISLGEDFRSGRWWWEQEGQKECGLHVSTKTP